MDALRGTVRLATPVAGQMARAVAEHQRVLDHLRDGATDKAVVMLRQHLSRVYSTLAKLVERYPEYFDGAGGNDSADAGWRSSGCQRVRSA